MGGREEEGERKRERREMTSLNCQIAGNRPLFSVLLSRTKHSTYWDHLGFGASTFFIGGVLLWPIFQVIQEADDFEWDLE